MNTANALSAVLKPATRASHREPVMHKYVVLQSSSALRLAERVIVFDRELMHSEVLPDGVRAVSAGFVAMPGDGQCLVVPGSGSETLGLSCRLEQDQRLLNYFFQSPI